MFCDALTGGAADLGLYRAATDGGAVVAQSLFASAQSIASANATGINARFEADDIANVEKRIWELLGLTADPNLEYDVGLTLTAGISASGTLALQGVFSW
uniref:Putative MFS family major facilitator transporter n=1 Tax=uncultured bacterium 878 TaxID=548895 RepID=B8R8K7_9BACT|nr:putative MFS family major facilitator transporter [uncultured bacterium 878]